MIEVLALLVTASFTVYASPSGADSNPGSLAKPVRTLARAINIVRKDRNGRAALISLAGGDYPSTGSTVLSEIDGNLVIDGHGKARILGGVAVSKSSKVVDPDILSRLSGPARTSVRVADLNALGLDAGTLRYRGFADGNAVSALELFSNGEPMTLARYPNKGKWLDVDAVVNPKTFYYPGDRPATWKSPDAWVFGYFHFDWCDTYDKAKLDTTTKTVELSREPDYGVAAKRRFYFFNVLEELDSPGEYLVDRASKKLYFWPTTAQSKVVASQVEKPLLHLDKAQNVTVTGVVVTETGFTGTGPTPAVTCPSSALAPGDTMDCTASYVVLAADLTLGSIDNPASVTGVTRTGTVGPATSTTTVIVNRAVVGAVLAATGMSNTLGLVSALGLLVIGVTLVVSRRRRQSRAI